MCTSLLHHNYRLHFYIIVSKQPHKLNRKDDQFFENMNTYEDEESPEKKNYSNRTSIVFQNKEINMVFSSHLLRSNFLVSNFI
jgi:hypothetical protein